MQSERKLLLGNDRSDARGSELETKLKELNQLVKSLHCHLEEAHPNYLAQFNRYRVMFAGSFAVGLISTGGYFNAGNDGGTCGARNFAMGGVFGIGSVWTNLRLNTMIWFFMLMTTPLGKKLRQGDVKTYNAIQWLIASVCAIAPLIFYFVLNEIDGLNIGLNILFNLAALPQTSYSLLGVGTLFAGVWPVLKRLFMPQVRQPALFLRAKDVLAARLSTFEEKYLNPITNCRQVSPDLKDALSGKGLAQVLEFLAENTNQVEQHDFWQSLRALLPYLPPAALMLISRYAFAAAGFYSPYKALDGLDSETDSALSSLASMVGGVAAVGFSVQAFWRLGLIPKILVKNLLSIAKGNSIIFLTLLLSATDFFSGGPSMAAMLMAMTGGIKDEVQDKFCGHLEKPSAANLFWMWCAELGSSLLVNGVVSFFLINRLLAVHESVTNQPFAEAQRDMAIVEEFKSDFLNTLTPQLLTELLSYEKCVDDIKAILLSVGGTDAANLNENNLAGLPGLDLGGLAGRFSLVLGSCQDSLKLVKEKIDRYFVGRRIKDMLLEGGITEQQITQMTAGNFARMPRVPQAAANGTVNGTVNGGHAADENTEAPIGRTSFTTRAALCCAPTICSWMCAGVETWQGVKDWCSDTYRAVLG